MEQAPMYGVSYYAIKNKSGTDLVMGVDCFGLMIYKPDNLVIPKISFTWSEIHCVSYSGKMFSIKPIGKDDPSLVIYTKSAKQNDEILSLIIGNHVNYMKRRKQDPALEKEIKEAKKVQETEDKEKEQEIKYENSLKDAIATGAVTEEAEKKVKDNFEESKKLMQDQISAMKKLADEEKQKREQAEKETDELRKTAQAMEQKLLKEKQNADALALIEAERLSKEDMKKQEIEELNKKLSELELKHKQDLAKLEEVKKQSASAPPAVAPITTTKPVSYEDENKKKNEALRENIKNVGTLMKNRKKVNDEQGKQIEMFSNASPSKFETLKNLRKNNTRARIDEFEAML